VPRDGLAGGLLERLGSKGISSALLKRLRALCRKFDLPEHGGNLLRPYVNRHR
jgi:hypothetical protein